MSNENSSFELGQKFGFKSPFEGAGPPEKYEYLESLNINTKKLIEFLKTSVNSGLASARFDYLYFIRLREEITAAARDWGMKKEYAEERGEALSKAIPNPFGNSFAVPLEDGSEKPHKRFVRMRITVNTRKDDVDFTAPYTELDFNSEHYTIAFRYTKPVSKGGNYAVKLSFKNFEEFSLLLHYLNKDYVLNHVAYNSMMRYFKAQFSLLEDDAEELCRLYLKTPKAVLYNLGPGRMLKHLNTIAKLGNEINERDINEEMAVLKLLTSFYDRDPYAKIILPEEAVATVGNKQPISEEAAIRQRVDQLMDGLAVITGGVTLFEKLYHAMDDRWGDDNFTEFIRQIYIYWSFSSYHSNPQKVPYNGAPENFHYNGNKVLGFYTSDFTFTLSGQYIDVHVVDYEATSKLPARARAKGEEEYKLLGNYHIFQPITLDRSDLKGEIKLPNRIIPAFYLKAFEDKNNTANFEKAMWVVAEIAGTALAVGNLLRLRHLVHLTRLGRAARITFAGLQVATGVVSTLLQFVNDCNEENWCAKVRSYLFWVDVCTLGVDLLAQQLMKKAAREAADGYRAYRSSLGDDALEEADYARNEQAQARREAQEHLDEVANNKRLGPLMSELSGPPIDPVLLNKIIKSFKRQGGKILCGTDEAIDFLNFRSKLEGTKVYGMTYNEKLIYLEANPSAGTVYEELIHSAQFRTGKYNTWVEKYGNATTTDIMEKEAAEKLLKNAQRWKISDEEVLQIQDRLEYYTNNLKKAGL
jgi:hypothetical protein